MNVNVNVSGFILTAVTTTSILLLKKSGKVSRSGINSNGNGKCLSPLTPPLVGCCPSTLQLYFCNCFLMDLHLSLLLCLNFSSTKVDFCLCYCFCICFAVVFHLPSGHKNSRQAKNPFNKIMNWSRGRQGEVRCCEM